MIIPLPLLHDPGCSLHCQRSSEVDATQRAYRVRKDLLVPTTCRRRNTSLVPLTPSCCSAPWSSTRRSPRSRTQQNVSRIAGEIWNVLDDDIKKAWHDKAVEYQIEHKMKHPDYKFAPSRKAPGEVHGRHGTRSGTCRKRKPKARKAKYDDEDFNPAPKRSRARTRREVAEEPVSPSPRPHRPEPTFALSLLLFRHGVSSLDAGSYAGSSSLDLMMRTRSHDLVEDPLTTTNSMSFGHIPMPSPYNLPWRLRHVRAQHARTWRALRPHASYYQPFYGGSTSHLTDTPAVPAPTPSEAAESFGGYEFNFTDDLLANIVNANVPLSAPAETRPRLMTNKDRTSLRPSPSC
ncbi:hypothetical protein BC629DRAFT_1735320 [Irpex lacteus]|nr:hypothetical protein BC629DRAFT_1735320 [Irpex lacteus]